MPSMIEPLKYIPLLYVKGLPPPLPPPKQDIPPAPKGTGPPLPIRKNSKPLPPPKVDAGSTNKM